ncbi:hypothetical protein, partial [Caulobacter sp. 17J65-9]|uniref:hypothetical protein n=1 Tax=Caulobacter sp. 17J65-9 TaxID=2709382 RepID=UPI0013C91933
ELAGTAAEPLREFGGVLAAAALSVRVLNFSLHRRAARADARRELGRRLDGLNDALLDLRRALTRDEVRRFLDRRDAYATSIGLTGRWLSDVEMADAEACAARADGMAELLGDTAGRRSGAEALTLRVRREIGRAVRSGELKQPEADDLNDLVDDAVKAADEGLYAEWNADHFGRLSAHQRHFRREIERCTPALAERLERHGGALFDHLLQHADAKVAVADLLARWAEAHRSLELRLAGLNPPPRPAPAAEEEETPRVAERFVLPRAPSAAMFPSGRARLRLPAAND